MHASAHSDFSRWVRGAGLEIILYVLGAALLGRLVHWLAARYAESIQSRSRVHVAQGDQPSEARKHLLALIQAGEWLMVATIYFVAAVMVLLRFGVPLTTLVAPATVAGVAIGFGAQRLVQDLLGGFFLFAERQYGYGDVVRVAQPGQVLGITGTVEELTLRTTKLRNVQGEVVIIPNGEVRQVTNLSRDWSRAVVDVPVPIGEDIVAATAVLEEVARATYRDDSWRPWLLDQPGVVGVESIEVDHVQLRLTARTLPGKQWDVGRELRCRAARDLQQAGIGSAAA